MYLQSYRRYYFHLSHFQISQNLSRLPMWKHLCLFKYGIKWVMKCHNVFAILQKRPSTPPASSAGNKIYQPALFSNSKLRKHFSHIYVSRGNHSRQTQVIALQGWGWGVSSVWIWLCNNTVWSEMVLCENSTGLSVSSSTQLLFTRWVDVRNVSDKSASS